MKFRILSEGLSNFNDELRQDAVEFFKKEWAECKRKRKAGDFFMEKHYIDKKTGKKVIFLLSINAYRLGENKTSNCESRAKKTKKGVVLATRININLSRTLDIVDFHELMGTLEHELTHTSQEINNMIEYYLDKEEKHGITRRMYSATHSTFPYEKEAALVNLFYLIKNTNSKRAAEFFEEYIEYWMNIGYGYKTFLKKAADYGLTNKEIVRFRNAVKRMPAWFQKTKTDFLGIRYPLKKNKF